SYVMHHRSPSAFGAELPAAYEVQMQMRDRHPRIVADIEGEAVSGYRDALQVPDLGRELEHRGERRTVFELEVARPGDVVIRDDEHMHGRAWIDVVDGERLAIFSHLR